MRRPPPCALFCLLALVLLAPTSARAAGASEDGLWTELGVPPPGPAALAAAPRSHRRFRADDARLRQRLSEAPLELSGAPGVAMSLPMPDGGYARVRIEESPILSPELQQESPDLRGYRAQGVDDPTATGRLDLTPAGFHALLITASGTAYVDPIPDSPDYVSYWKQDLPREPFRCGHRGSLDSAGADFAASTHASGDRLRTYRLAVSATGQYTEFYRSPGAAQAQVATTVNRVAALFEREVAISFLLSAVRIHPDPATDPFFGGLGNFALQNQRQLDAEPGSASYDIGHVFHQGPNAGLAYTGVCDPGYKGSAGSSRGNPTGAAFVDLVSHEIGHQLGAGHTWNGTSCAADQFHDTSAYEPGSGSTIMSYAGTCSGQNVQGFSDDYFHTRSFEEMAAYRDGIGACGSLDATANRTPTVDAGPPCTLPKRTPFRLTALAEDADGDPLTFNWEQFDLGTRNPSPLPTSAVGPVFRSRRATASPTRTFPRFEDILSGAPTPWEVLPGVDRTLNFRVTVRDGRAGGGGVDYDSTALTVTGLPFACTSPAAGATLECGGATRVEWSVGGGAVSPDVRIQASADGGASFAPLVEATPNDGSETVAVPAEPTGAGRILVEASAECFFSVCGRFSVVDRTPPVLEAPPAVVAECSSPAGTPAALGTPFARDLCDGAVGAANDAPAAYPLGDTLVTWTAADASGHVATHDQTVTVLDRVPPAISCNAPDAIARSDAPTALRASASDACDPAPRVAATGFECYRLTPQGRRIDKTRSCRVALAGGAVEILRPPAVGDRIEWTLVAADASGNRSEATCGVLVASPGGG